MRDPVLAVIPARLSSTRLPRKPLHPVLGRPMIAWVWGRVSAMSLFDRVVVATDSDEVVEVCRRMGAEAVLTDPAHPSGTDRVAEVARLPAFSSHPLVVNVQGDEPLVEEEHLARALALVTPGKGDWDVGTCATPIRSPGARRDPSVVKVAVASDGRALYFSRAPIPHKRDGEPGEGELAGPPFLRHIGIYTYRRAALLDWVALPPSPLEELEKLEQLRPLEAGLGIGVAVVGEAASGVDTAADVARMEEALSRSDEGPQRSGNAPTLTHGS
jgi:3-deoxy-manno-octulosonate cytidylyltransferase (CMP-KDO synthetase)